MSEATPEAPPLSHDPGSPLAPVDERQRLVAIDILRGTAVLGIFMVNILAFAYPAVVMINPRHAALEPYTGEFTGVNYVLWIVQHLFFDMKMMAIFSMLFGAGVVLMASRTADAGRQAFTGIYYRRILWLLLIGLLHAYFIWYGDILVLYAICGLLLYPLRNWQPLTLVLTGAAALVIPILTFIGMGVFLWILRDTAEQAQSLLAAGEMPTSQQRAMMEAWQEARAGIDPTPEQIEEQIATFRGTAPQVIAKNAITSLSMQLYMFPMWGVWRAGGLMLIGMALMKLGVFSAARSRSFYIKMLALGYGIGLPIVALGIRDQIASNFDGVRVMTIGWNYNYVGSIGVALGHVAVVMLAVKAGLAGALLERLAAVGRMALTNYLAQSLIAGFFFFGWGLGFFATLERPWVAAIVLAVWALQLAWSHWWLARFRYGPMEWLWRTLTYMQVQPLRR